MGAAEGLAGFLPGGHPAGTSARRSSPGLAGEQRRCQLPAARRPPGPLRKLAAGLRDRPLPAGRRYIQHSIEQREKEIAEDLAQQKREEQLETRGRRFLQALAAIFAIAMIVSLFLANSARNAQQTAETESYARATAQAQAEDDRQEAISQAEARAEAEAVALEERGGSPDTGQHRSRRPC